MVLTVKEKEVGKFIEVVVSGKLSAEDYEQFVPKVEKDIAQNGKVRILFVMEDFHGWDMGALWQDIKFDIKHFADIECLAMVGDKKWEKGMAKFCIPFTKAKIRFFPPEEIEDARKWLQDF